MLSKLVKTFQTVKKIDSQSHQKTWPAEEMLRVERVGEGDRDHLDGEVVHSDVELVHHRRARWEMEKPASRKSRVSICAP